MKTDQDAKQSSDKTDNATSRREFLRKSIYAAYATPLITALLVEKASAFDSGKFCDKHPDHWKCQ